MKLNEDLVLPKAGRYTASSEPGRALPVVYGSFLDEEVSPEDTEIGGATPAVLIDRLNGIWLINAAQSHPDKPRLYMNKRLQADDQFAYNPAALLGDAQGNVHTVAVITLNPDIVGLVLENEFSVDMKGAVDANLNLITNPVDALHHFFTTFGTWTTADFDAGSLTRARNAAYATGQTVHWCFNEDKTYKQHLTEVLLHYHGSHILNFASQVVMTIPQHGFISHEDIVKGIDVRRDVFPGRDPDDEVEYDLDRRNVANVLNCKYRYSWATGDYGKTAEPTAPASILRYGVRRRSYDLPGIRSDHHLNTWTNEFFNRYALLPAIVSFSLRTLLNLALQRGAYITMNWAWGPGAHGEGWTNRILQVLNESFSFRGQYQTLQCFDTGKHLLLPTYLVMQDQAGGTHYLRATTGRTWQLLDTAPGVSPILPNPVRWIQRQSPDDTVWYIYPTPNDQQGISRLTAAVVQPSVGPGTSEFLGFVDAWSRAWGIEVTNAGTIQRTDLLSITPD